MAIKFSCNSCGKRLSVKDEFAGRRSKCPGCGWGVVVPMESEWAVDEPPSKPAATGPPSLPAVPGSSTVPAALALIKTGDDDDDEPVPYRSPVRKTAGRRSPYLLAGSGLIFVCALSAGGFVAWNHYQDSRRLAREASIRQVILDPTKADIALWAEIVKAMVDRQVQSIFKDNETVEAVKISSIDVRLAPDDPRMIPWLWEVNATIAVRFKPPPSGGAGFGATYFWKSLAQCVPHGPAGECWREVTDPGDGSMTRNHYKLSEWTEQFRGQVNSEWLRCFELLEKDIRQEGQEGRVLEFQRKTLLQVLKKRLAEAFKITDQQFEEILKATG
jgi:hypothetical protein